MKVLHLLISLSTLCSCALLAQDTLDNYISDTKKDKFKFDYEKNEAESSKLRDSWISPLDLNYNYSKSNPYDSKQLQESAAIKMSQKIFASGGIYYGIKYAYASKIYSDYSIDVAKRKLVKDAISTLMQIKQMDFKVMKQKLQIQNSEISLNQKKEQYLNGQIDSGFLNNAVIERNVAIQGLYDLQTNKQKLISRFNAISDMDYKQAHIPNLSLLTLEEFLKYNIVLSMSQSDIVKNKFFKDVTVSKYMPSVNFNAGYSWQKSENQTFFAGSNQISHETDYYNYGFSVRVPLDINTFRDIESSKVSYLKSKVNIQDSKRELTAIFEQVMQNIKNLQNKKQLSIENKDIYEELLSQTKEMFSAGYRTKYDVTLLQNSVNIQETDVKIFDIDKQLELLTLYEMYKND
jgi:hypothetical protein